MKALLIGGTGTLSLPIANLLVQKNWDVTVVNRGSKNQLLPPQVRCLHADIRNEQELCDAIGDETFDVVCDFIAFDKSHVLQDVRVFQGRCSQYIFISSASAYHKPCADYVIREGTSLVNPYWEYSRNKIACENALMEIYAATRFPVTIVRPSHTYGDFSVPVAIHGNQGCYQVLLRILEGKPVLIPGDGTSLWTVTHNSDFAKGFVGLMGNSHAVGEVFHITGDEVLTWDQIMKTVAAALGKELIPYHVASDFISDLGPYDFRGSMIGDKSNSVVFDNSKLKAAVPGYKATTPFAIGVRQTIDYIMSHPELQVPDPEFDAYCDKIISLLEDAKKKFNTL